MRIPPSPDRGLPAAQPWSPRPRAVPVQLAAFPAGQNKALQRHLPQQVLIRFSLSKSITPLHRCRKEELAFYSTFSSRPAYRESTQMVLILLVACRTACDADPQSRLLNRKVPSRFRKSFPNSQIRFLTRRAIPGFGKSFANSQKCSRIGKVVPELRKGFPNSQSDFRIVQAVPDFARTFPNQEKRSRIRKGVPELGKPFPDSQKRSRIGNDAPEFAKSFPNQESHSRVHKSGP
jgi:hypothetical protein